MNEVNRRSGLSQAKPRHAEGLSKPRKASLAHRTAGTARRVSPAVDSEPDVEVPITESEFVERCKELEAATVEDTADDNSVDDIPTYGDGKRKLLRMDKNKNILLIEPDGTETPITMRDAAFTYGSNFILRLTQGIACGGDISTVELD